MVKLKDIFKNRNNFMNEISINFLKEVSTGDGSSADQGEPDTGFIKKGKSLGFIKIRKTTVIRSNSVHPMLSIFYDLTIFSFFLILLLMKNVRF